MAAEDPVEGTTGPCLPRRQLVAAISTSAVASGAFAGGSGAVISDAITDDGGRADEEVIREEVWVETTVDTDESGEPDRIHVEIARPEPAGDDEQYPVIMKASPYFGGRRFAVHGDEEMLYDRETEPAAGRDGTARQSVATGLGVAPAVERFEAADVTTGQRISPPDTTHGQPLQSVEDPVGPTALERRYLPQGYAIAYASSLGRHESTGCDIAAGPASIDALESVVDWFNDRATAYDSPAGGDAVTAEWATGTTGMIGASGEGELANGVATTGVDGLEAIVPQVANASQYSLFRANGTPIDVDRGETERIQDLGTWLQVGTVDAPECAHWVERVEEGQERITGNYNDFWDEREFLTDASDVDSAVLIAHAVDDSIVKPNQFADWYDVLEDHDVPVRLWLYEGGHRPPDGDEWQTVLDRWWEYWLKGVDNGVMEEDPVSIVRGGSTPAAGSLETHEGWPVPAAEPTTLRFRSGGETAGTLTVDEPGSGDESLIDDPSQPATDLVAADESAHRLRYETPPLAESVRVSGRIVPDLSVTVDGPAILSVALVEYSADRDASIVTRGWADPRNRPSYGEHDTPVAYKDSLRDSAPLESGERVNVEFPLEATEHSFDAGSRIGLVIYASDRRFTHHPPGEAELTVSLAESSTDLPVVGGQPALTDAFDDDDGGGDDAIPGLGIGAAVAALGAGAAAVRGRFGTDGD